MSPDWAVAGKNRYVTVVVARVPVVEINPGTLTSGSAKSGWLAGAPLGRARSMAWACSPIASSVAGGTVLESCSTTIAWLSAREAPKRARSCTCALSAGVLFGTSWMRPNPEAAPKSGRNAAAAIAAAIHTAMSGSPRYAVKAAYSLHGHATVDVSSVCCITAGEGGGEEGGEVDMRRPRGG